MASTGKNPTSAFVELSKTSARELFRNVKVVLVLSTLFIFFLALVIGMNALVNGGDKAVVGVVEGSERAVSLVDVLERRGYTAEAVDRGSVPRQGDHTAVIEISADRAIITLAVPGAPAWIELAGIVEGFGISHTNTTVINAAGFQSVDFLRSNLGTVLVMGFLGLALMGTAVPIVSMRKNGTLRLFGTTPVKRLTFLVAQTPVQFALGVVQGTVVVAIAFASGYVESLDAARLVVTFLLGLAMFFAFGYLLASRSVNPELIQQLCGVLPVFVALTSGLIVPFQLLPDAFADVPKALPTTWFMQAVSADVAGTEPFLSVYVLWAFMAGATLVMALIGARLFRWDQGDL